jgi:Ca2+-binding EF-hand superfamily protein
MKIFTARRWSVACLLAAVATAQAQTSASMPPPVAQPTTEASTTFKRWDKNSDNTLSAAEFAAGWQGIQAANTLRNLHDNFVAKDVDRNGSLGASEYLKLDLIQKAGTSAPPMGTFDTDKNQSLDFKEYVGLVGSLIKPKP